MLQHHKSVICELDKICDDVYFFNGYRGCIDYIQILLLRKDKELEYRQIFELFAYKVSSNNKIELIKTTIKRENMPYLEPEERTSIMKSAIYNRKITFAVLLNYENELYEMNQLNSASLMKPAEMNDPHIAKAIEIEKE